MYEFPSPDGHRHVRRDECRHRCEVDRLPGAEAEVDSAAADHEGAEAEELAQLEDEADLRPHLGTFARRFEGPA